MPEPSDYLTSEELVDLLDYSVSTKTLANWRCDPREPGPKFVRFGNRIRYPRAEANKWIEGRLHGSTIEYAPRQGGRKSTLARDAAEREALSEKREQLRAELAAIDAQLLVEKPRKALLAPPHKPAAKVSRRSIRGGR